MAAVISPEHRTRISDAPVAGAEASPETRPEAHEEIRTIEAVVEPNAPIVGRTAGALHFEHRFETKLLAISRRGERIRERLNDVAFVPGDLLATDRKHQPAIGRELEVRHFASEWPFIIVPHDHRLFTADSHVREMLAVGAPQAIVVVD